MTTEAAKNTQRADLQNHLDNANRLLEEKNSELNNTKSHLEHVRFTSNYLKSVNANVMETEEFLTIHLSTIVIRI